MYMHLHMRSSARQTRGPRSRAQTVLISSHRPLHCAVRRRVPLSVAKLVPLVDECVTIDNNSRQPRLKTSRDVRALLRVCREVGGDCGSRHLESWLPTLE